MNRMFCDQCDNQIGTVENPRHHPEQLFATHLMNNKFLVRTNVVIDRIGDERSPTRPDLCNKCFGILASIALREIRDSLQDERGN